MPFTCLTAFSHWSMFLPVYSSSFIANLYSSISLNSETQVWFGISSWIFSSDYLGLRNFVSSFWALAFPPFRFSSTVIKASCGSFLSSLSFQINLNHDSWMIPSVNCLIYLGIMKFNFGYLLITQLMLDGSKLFSLFNLLFILLISNFIKCFFMRWLLRIAIIVTNWKLRLLF